MNSLKSIKAVLKTGEEKLTYNEKNLNFSLLDFWRWSVSDIVSNATRGRLAEFIVATAVNIDIKEIRDEWGAFDLETSENIKIEVKSAAYIQSWEQKKLSTISFSTKPSQPWSSEIDKRSTIAIRSADVYVFCLLHHSDKSTINPLNLNHWEFYVLSTEKLNNYKRSQHSITIKSLRDLTAPVEYDKLKSKIEQTTKHLV
ncbi:hypothetical protein LNQ49_05625 [Flavobacterium sp. F-65]|jgi:hypothetical protein|uniref:Restriction endonuclease n=1 Tax=Flavobacterium pisciphilum TaxID=2893755 RepID=A0ABS8MQP3_9FLAO|nr:hypothetical protein [Flavobacterium sp. F-65]MCC9071074.1 hypothetical protein [Flavobacterium sp. F-65]